MINKLIVSLNYCRLEDGRLEKLEEHEESVYSCAWATNDPWVFATLSLDGRVVISRVKRHHKYAILQLWDIIWRFTWRRNEGRFFCFNIASLHFLIYAIYSVFFLLTGFTIPSLIHLTEHYAKLFGVMESEADPYYPGFSFSNIYLSLIRKLNELRLLQHFVQLLHDYLLF